jgi:tetraacyldisaccharide 4'-kinase
MKLKTPSFWYRPSGSKPEAIEFALTPVSGLYRLAYEIHQSTARQEKFDIPILCIGNLNAGGTGKTPSALALMETIKKHQIAHNPFFMSRGYGGGEYGPLFVDPQKHTAWHTGDEPIVLAAAAPTIVSGNRAQGILLAMHRRADLVLMDDGLQNPHIKKDICIVVINGEMGFGNGKMLPAGPLREPLKRGLKKADAFILIGEDKRNVRDLLPAGKPIFTSTLHSRDYVHVNRRYLAFAGIGYPEKFYNFLREKHNADIVETVNFPDHYPYTEEDAKELQAKASALDAELITTEKDYIRLPKPPGFHPHVLRIQMEWDNEAALVGFLKSRLTS